jgi:hypothetical protein
MGMGALFLVAGEVGPRSDLAGARARAQFASAGLGVPWRWSHAGMLLDAYPRVANPEDALVRLPGGDFVAAAGTFVLGEQGGAAALRTFYDRFDGTSRALADTAGHFLLAIGRGERVWLLRDRNGAYEAYAAIDGSAVSSSFLALAAAQSKLTVNRQAAYEYVFDGVTLGDDSPFNEIRKLGIDEMLVWDRGWRSERLGWPLMPSEMLGDRQAALGSVLERLTALVRRCATAAGGKARLALSGGYDSRLIVALLLRAGIQPELYVYGPESSSDVRVAKAIAAAEGLPLTHLDKDEAPMPAPEAFPDIVARNYLVGDGMPWGGVFGRGAEHQARAERHAGGYLLLNGGGGELMRNFFALLDRPIAAADLARCFYSQFDPAACAAGFSQVAHLERIAAKMRRIPGLESDPLTRRMAEAVYPHFRCRSWNGRESTANSRFGPWLLPFYDYEATQAALALPVAWKSFGDFEGALIRLANPRLAAYASNYGHGFDVDAPIKRRLRTMADWVQPPWFRQHRFAIKRRFAARPAFSPLLGPDYAGRIVDLSLPYMSKLFRVERIVDEAQYARILTLEHLYQTLNASFD